VSAWKRQRGGLRRILLHIVMGEEEIGVRAVEDDDVQLDVAVDSRSMRSTSSESSLVVVGVMVLMGGWSKVTLKNAGAGVRRTGLIRPLEAS
jgi:hypothetical protein